MLGQNWRSIAKLELDGVAAGTWCDLPATDKQRAILAQHGVTADQLTRGEAYQLIRAQVRQQTKRVIRSSK